MGSSPTLHVASIQQDLDAELADEKQAAMVIPLDFFKKVKERHRKIQTDSKSHI